MKNTFKYLFIFACSLASVVSCARFDEQDDAPVAEQKVRMTFTAEIEGDTDADTKTTLGGQMGDQYRKVLWEPGDSVGITNSIWYNHMDKFINTEVGTSEVATFEGSTNYGDTYYLFYPYHENLYCEGNGTVRFNLPAGQRYRNQSFDSGSMPMVAKGNRTERFQFQSLCGVLALNMTGSETVRSVSFTGRDESGNPIPVAGDFSVNMNYKDYPEVTLIQDETGTTMATVTLDCGEEGIALDPANATPFYIVLPVGTYNEFSVVVATTDGKLMLKESKKPLTIKRANVTKTSALAYVADVAVDLSEIGHANCYIVPESGLYSFDANVIGNGEFGLVENAKFHTSNTSIEPASAELLWEDRTGVISGLVFDGEKVSFMSTGIEGNALVAVKDANGTILWSWHIWVTDQPQEHVYVNDRGTFTMLDRNIGATRNDRGTGEDWRESQGLRYQWGRKDPFGQTFGSEPVYRIDMYNRISAQISLDESIQYPKSFVQNNTPWTTEMDYNLWSVNQKTIYDPCPVGYRVPPMDVWRGFTEDGENADRRSEMNVSGSFDHGWNFIYDGTNTAWYPTSYHISTWGDFYESEYEGNCWSIGDQDTYQKKYFRFYYDVYSDNPEFNCSIEFNQTREVSNAHAIRCMKDEGHVDTSYPTVKVKDVVDVTSESAVVVASVTDEGVSEVTERGIIWGLDDNLTVDLGNKVVADVAGGGEYRTTLTGLQNATIYYVRPYAINSRGLSYGKVSSFRTTYAGDANNLSAYGTSNCYIVDPAYCKHYINGSVKGSGYESIGSVESVEVLWETNGYGMKTDPGTVIFDVTLKDGNIYFYTNGVEGNALVASKDAMGTILWSWHIWVTDTPQEQLYNYNYWLLDRNLGAVSADEGMGDEWKLSCGLMYQPERKDPFAGYAFTQEYAYFSVDDAVTHPTVYDYNWNSEDKSGFWSTIEKTVYDPCPVGYRIVVNDVWNGIQSVPGNGHGTYFYFDTNPSARSWYPVGPEYTPYGVSYWEEVRMLSAEGGYFWGNGNDHFHHRRQHGQVRCMKDEGYVDMSYPIVGLTSIDGISSAGANLYAEITNTGIAEITSRGFIWGTSDDLSLTSGTKVDCGSGSGEFNTSLDGLSHSTRYYVRAYATNERGTSYSDVKSFYTPFEGDAVNLSRNGTANCYIVPVAYSDYIFNASVKGNSDESVGAIDSAEVLWETRNTSSAIEVGDIIETVSLDGNNIRFRLPFDPVPGNALIAVKDALGTILWSWHIWVVDFDPEETQQKYISGAVMMDRNLGALSVIPAESMSGDYGAYGLYYQWGRKDPAPLHGNIIPSDVVTWYNVPGYNTLEESIWNPTTFAADIDWNTSDKWSISKTMYDPCPYGWRVAEPGVWEGINNEIFTNCGNLYRIIPEPYSVPAAYCPMGGEYYSVWPGFNSFNDYGSWWTSSYSDRAVRIHWSDTFYWEHGMNSSFGLSVRCMKDIGTEKPGSGDDVIVDDEYEW